MSSIRAIALAVPRRGDDLLVFEYLDAVKNERFHRPLGGGIEFGETAEVAVRREMREELGAEIEDVRLIGVLENIFHAFGRDGHEIVFVFGCRLTDPDLYRRDTLGTVLDDAAAAVRWRSLDSDPRPLYPDGLAELLRAGTGSPSGSGPGHNASTVDLGRSEWTGDGLPSYPG